MKWTKRDKETIILEQVRTYLPPAPRVGNKPLPYNHKLSNVLTLQAMAQIFSNPTVKYGLLTNLERWCVLERVGDIIKVTLLPGVQPNGRNNGFNVMLATSLAAIGPEGVADLRGS
jgi:hypothetical protein